jgi:hypothetical protein
MNRRGFLGALTGGIIAAKAVLDPKPLEPPQPTTEMPLTMDTANNASQAKAVTQETMVAMMGALIADMQTAGLL